MATSQHQRAAQGRLGPHQGPVCVPASIQEIAKGRSRALQHVSCSGRLFVLPARQSVKIRVSKGHSCMKPLCSITPLGDNLKHVCCHRRGWLVGAAGLLQMPTPRQLHTGFC